MRFKTGDKVIKILDSRHQKSYTMHQVMFIRNDAAIISDCDLEFCPNSGLEINPSSIPFRIVKYSGS